jgi:alkaline phosphatase D
MRLSFSARVAGFVSVSLATLSGCGGGGHHGGGTGGQAAGVHVLASGDVTTTTAVLWARGYTSGNVTFQVATDAAFHNIVKTQSVAVVDPLVPVKVDVSGLTAATTYFFRTRPQVAGAEVGTFRTPAAAGVHAGLHFAVLGDWRNEMLPYPAIRNAAAMNLDFAVELGDTVYADVGSPDVPLAQASSLLDFRKKHDEVYRARTALNTLGDLRDSTWVLATDDDHEIMDNWAGGADVSTDPRFAGTAGTLVNDTVLFDNAMQAFVEFNPIRDELWTGTGVPEVEGERNFYRQRTFGADAAVFVLDERSFRSPMLTPPDPTVSGDIDRFKQESYDATRTMLGTPQLAKLEADLQAAQTAGVTWKFVMIPEPIQNLGVGNAEDRYEGYAYERAKLLGFIHDNAIKNVVFVTADIHGTVFNNLQYQPTGPNDAQVDVDGAFEVSVPAVAYDPPMGQDVINSITLTDAERTAYENMSMDDKDDFFRGILDNALEQQGYDDTGIGATVDATLVSGKWVRAHAYGWVEFQINPGTLELTINVWGIDPYHPADAAAAASDVPTILTTVTARPRP